jgi:uncharacterized protein YndB with AHSA1/START domain
MAATRVFKHINAPRGRVYRALTDAAVVARWMVPDGMAIHVHTYDVREGGKFRVSLTYEAPDAVGKSSAHTDTYHGHFVRLLPDQKVEQVIEFETADPNLQGKMRVVISLADGAGGTDVFAVHDHLPTGLSAVDNETGWRMSLAKLAALAESG